METKNVKLSNSSRILIMDQSISKIISIFLDIFLAAYFYKITEQNVLYLSLYHMIGWFVATIGAFMVGDYIKRKNKVNLYRFGTFVKSFYIFMIIVMKEKIVDYVYVIGIMYGLSTATTGFPFNMIESEQVSTEERSQYLGYKSMATEIIGLVMPILLGAYITFRSYEMVAILILVFSFVKFFLCFLIENKNVQKEKTNLKRFWKVLRKDVILKKLYLIEFLKGITRYGVMSLIVSLLIIYQTKNDLELGSWTSFLSLLTIFAMYLFGKYYEKSQKKKILFVTTIAVFLSSIGIFISINMVTMIVYNIVYAIFMNILLNITEVNLFDYSNQGQFKDELNTEYFIFRELFLNIGRIFRLHNVIHYSRNNAKFKFFEDFICTNYSIHYGNHSNDK